MTEEYYEYAKISHILYRDSGNYWIIESTGDLSGDFRTEMKALDILGKNGYRAITESLFMKKITHNP